MLRDTVSAAVGSIDASFKAELTDLRPPPSGLPAVMAIFLYEVVEEPSMRNRGRTTTFDGVRYDSVKSPLALVLRYLLVPYAGDRNAEYELLGRTLQALHQRSLTVSPDLPGALSPMDVVSVTLAPLSLEERTRVWWSISQPYRLSLNYEARVVDIDVESDQALEPVTRREFDVFSPASLP
jgi:Pvc16 N-terminal domain